jgi:hypothetical protein
MNNPYILTTGDVVRDIAVYQGDVVVPGDPGTVKPYSTERLGGARHLHEIIEKTVGKDRAFFGLVDIDKPENGRVYPATYTLWKPSPGGPKDKATAPVWRVGEPLGYDLLDSAAGEPPLRRSEKEAEWGVPSVLVIDDAGLGFRTVRAKDRWPLCLQSGANDNSGASGCPAFVILKMSTALAQGDLWRKLAAKASCGQQGNLVVVTSANELRRAGAAISRGFSWERTLTELCAELEQHPSFRPLLGCSRHLIVNFGCEGAIWFDNDCAGAGNGATAIPQHCARLVYDPAMAEGQWPSTLASDAKVYGHLNTFTAAIAIGLFDSCNPETARTDDGKKVDERGLGTFEQVIRRGVIAVRTLREHGHGPCDNPPQFPFEPIKSVVRGPNSAELERFRSVAIPPMLDIVKDTNWTLCALAENMAASGEASTLPLYGLAHRIALYGLNAIAGVPHGRFGDLVSIDRYEMETLRGLHQRILAYVKLKKTKQPLCLGAFGPPGAGKSFGIKQIAREVLGKKVPILEFNLSQFDTPDMLIGAFHQVRDAVLKGETPVVFWDEFDCQEYKWLQYLLAPMQDGTFQESGHTHMLGKCIFVFAGGTSYDFEHFGPAPMPVGWIAEYASTEMDAKDLPPDADPKAITGLRSFYKSHDEKTQEDLVANDRFRLMKGPDFVSRLDGYINVLGPNRRRVYDWSARAWKIEDLHDITFPVRRAFLLRSFLGAQKNEDGLDIDRDLLRALLHVPRYVHGARSLEKIVKPLAESAKPYHRAYLPPPQVLNQHLDSRDKFEVIYRGNLDFLSTTNLHRIAAAIDENYNRLIAQRDQLARRELSEQEFVDAFNAMTNTWNKATNLAAAQRLPDVLALASLRLVQGEATSDEVKTVQEHLKNHLEILADEEHKLWMKFHLDNGWRQVTNQLDGLEGDARDAEISRLKKEERCHWLLLPFSKLPDGQKPKDHDAILHYPDMAELVGWKIVFAE